MAPANETKHGEERNRRIVTTPLGPPLVCDAPGGSVTLPASSLTETVVEKFCARCGWVECRGVMGALAFHFEHAASAHAPAKRLRISIPAGCRKVKHGIEIGDESFTVTGYLTRGYAGAPQTMAGPGEPAEPPEFYPLAVDDAAGVARDELLPLVEAKLAELTAEVVDDARDADEAQAEDAADGRREDRRLGL